MSSAPHNLEAVIQSGVAALRRGDAATARRAFDQAVAAGEPPPQLWLLVAQACDMLGDRDAADVALDRMLAADPRNLSATLMKGEMLTRGGDDRAAVAWYNIALATASTAGQLSPDIVERLRRADAARLGAASRFHDHLNERMTAAGVDPRQGYSRLAEALDLLRGAKTPQLQQPTSFFFPRLPHIGFYERGDFAWLAEIEAATPLMRAEIEAVLAEDHGLTPYVERPENRPTRAHDLLNDSRWSAFHLWRDGIAVEENARRCPRTMEALEGAPIPRIQERSPMALFSILRPHTHIPPHNGMFNTRLICHIPLVVPQGCRLRVGNEIRPVETGRALIFDDSIEHEAWNDSDDSRAVLLFEIWRPELTSDERRALTTMFEAITDYSRAGDQAPSPGA